MNPWIEHVRKYAQKKGMTYFQALKDPNVKKGYKKKTTVPISKKPIKGGAMGDGEEPSSDEELDPRMYAPGEQGLDDHVQQVLYMIAELEDMDELTSTYADRLEKDIIKLLKKKISISAKHDALTNIEKELRQATDGQVPDPHAF